MKNEDNQVELRVINADQVSCCDPSAQVIKVPEGESIRENVQDFYADQARNSSSCCGEASESIFYEPEMLSELPDDVAGFSLGCGDPFCTIRPMPS